MTRGELADAIAREAIRAATLYPTGRYDNRDPKVVAWRRGVARGCWRHAVNMARALLDIHVWCEPDLASGEPVWRSQCEACGHGRQSLSPITRATPFPHDPGCPNAHLQAGAA